MARDLNATSDASQANLNTLSEVEDSWLPIELKAILPTVSTEEYQKSEAEPWGGLGWTATLSRYLPQSHEDLLDPKVFNFVSANRAGEEIAPVGAGAIPESSIILQKWNGVVLGRDNAKFIGQLFGEKEDASIKRAEIDFEELPVEDRELVEPGATFVWTIGYRVRRGTRIRFSEFYFRRLARWSKEEINSAINAGAALGEQAGWFRAQ